MQRHTASHGSESRQQLTAPGPPSVGDAVDLLKAGIKLCPLDKGHAQKRPGLLRPCEPLSA